MLTRAVERGGSDLHLKVDSPPMARIDGELTAIDERSLTDGDLEAVMTVVTERTPAKREHFYTSGDLDTAYMAEDVGRFRVNGFRQRGSISFAFRYVPKEVPNFDGLGLPVGVQHLADVHRGLICRDRWPAQSSSSPPRSSSWSGRSSLECFAGSSASGSSLKSAAAGSQPSR